MLNFRNCIKMYRKFNWFVILSPLVFFSCSRSQHMESQPLLYDLISQYNDSINKIKPSKYFKKGAPTYYNVSIHIIENDTLIMIDGESFEHYWNFLPPPPPPPVDPIEEEKYRNIRDARHYGPILLNNDTVTIYDVNYISEEFINRFLGKNTMPSDSLYIKHIKNFGSECHDDRTSRPLYYQIKNNKIVPK